MPKHAYALLALALCTSALCGPAAAPAHADPAVDRPWMNPALSPERRAELALAKMTQDEKLVLVKGYFGSGWTGGYVPAPEARDGSAGYVPGIARLGIPPQWETDAGVGVASQGSAKVKRERTILPSGLATTATWNPEIAFQGGAMIGDEARRSGFNVMLAGGVNLTREPRNGRNFEYGGEDPLLAGTMDGAQVRGIQSNHIISTIKHFAFNDQETGRNIDNALIGEAEGRMSDLLAFQIAIEDARPGAIMCSYNRVDGVHSCENDYLLNQVLKGDWGFAGYVMSDWGGVHSTADAANHGLDQESGVPFDKLEYFGAPLKDAVASGQVSPARLDDMARRILWALFAKGVVDHPVEISAIDYAAHAKVAKADEEQAAVLLKNTPGLLPLAASAKHIVVIGGHADKGVLSGGGSAQVYPIGGNAVPGLAPTSWPGPVVYFPSSPLAEIKARAGGAKVEFADGVDHAAAAKLAASADVVVIFATQWTAESRDAPDLSLPEGQDALIAAVAAANPHTVVVLETGGAVLASWKDKVGAILEAWYPGSAGGAAIADLLFGKVNPSGRLPITFPASEAQLPRPKVDGVGLAEDKPFDVTYGEGAAVGYKWFDAQKLEPTFPFGYGLSYSSFAYGDLKAEAKAKGVTVSFTVRNTGGVAGMDTPQVYVAPVAGGWEAPKRLGGFKKVEVAPGAIARVGLAIDPRLLAVWDTTAHAWRIREGAYRIMLGASSRDLQTQTIVQLPGAVLPPSAHAATGGKVEHKAG
jgi:beta-glucosidase